MKFLSYSQNFEDLMLWRALAHVDSGFYVDVGANDPVIDSTTKAFYDRGWHGINIEPLQKHFEDIQGARPNDINLCIAVGSEAGELELWDFGVRGWGSASPEVHNKHKLNGHDSKSQIVPVESLAKIMEDHVVGEIHFLKIDVEGLEKQVLQGADFKSYRPWIVLVESTVPNSRDESFLEWEHFLLDSDYVYCYFDGLNRYYVSAEHQELNEAFSTPPNVFDEFELYAQYQKQQEIERLNLELTELRERLEQMQSSLAITDASLLEANASLSEASKSLAEVSHKLEVIVSSFTWRLRSKLVKFSVLRRHIREKKS